MLQIISEHEEVRTFIADAVSECFDRLRLYKEPEPEIIDGKVIRKRLDISEPTLIRWRQKGKIPYLRIGSAIRYNWHEVIKALEIPAKNKGGAR